MSLGGMPLETYDKTAQSGHSNFIYTATDVLGSLAFRYDQTAGAVNYHFFPYGMPWPGGTSDPTTTLQFTGQESEPESGLTHFLFRRYASLKKRWLAPDPAGWLVASRINPQSWNRYEYALDNPCTYVDPLGLSTCTLNVNISNLHGGNLNLTQIESTINEMLSLSPATNNDFVAINFQSNQIADSVLSIQDDAGVSKRLGENTPLGSLFGFIYVDEVLNDPLGRIGGLDRVIGIMGLHEIVHSVAAIPDLPYERGTIGNLMNYNSWSGGYRISQFSAAVAGDIPVSLLLTKSQADQLYNACLNQRKQGPAGQGGAGGGGGQGAGPNPFPPDAFRFWDLSQQCWQWNSDAGVWEPVPCKH